jgi:hypothetical protein
MASSSVFMTVSPMVFAVRQSASKTLPSRLITHASSTRTLPFRGRFDSIINLGHASKAVKATQRTLAVTQHKRLKLSLKPISMLIAQMNNCGRRIGGIPSGFLSRFDSSLQPVARAIPFATLKIISIR